jgi:predicted HTH domain antitoxin
MPLIIPDETLKQAGLTETEMKIEIACRLFDAGKLDLWPAAQLAGMSRAEFEGALVSRGIAPYRMDEEYVQHEIEYANQFGTLNKANPNHPIQRGER